MPCGQGAQRQQVLLGDLKVEIHICSLNEARVIENTLKTARDQCLIEDNPNNVKMILLDSSSTDRTVEIAENYVDYIVDCPPGKLTARDIGMRTSKADIIVAFDADVTYPRGTAARLVKPFVDSPDTVITSGRGVYNNLLLDMHGKIAHDIRNVFGFKYITSYASALSRDAYIACGGFDTKIPQQNLMAMWYEEEFMLADRMCNSTKNGKFVYLPNCIVYPSARRVDLQNPEWNKEVLEGKRF